MAGHRPIIRTRAGALFVLGVSVLAAASCSSSESTAPDSAASDSAASDSTTIETGTTVVGGVLAPTTAAPSASGEVPGTTVVDDPTLTAWESHSLPEPFSLLEGASGVLVYQAVVGEQMVVIGADASTGDERYRLDSSPLVRLRGTTPKLLVDRERGIVVRTTLDAIDAALVATALADGSELWRAPISAEVEQPFRCADAVCVRAPGDHRTFDIETGELVERSSVGSATTFGVAADGTVITASPRDDSTGNFDNVLAIEYPGDSVRWELPRRAIEQRAGVEVNPSAGWSTTIDGEAGIVVLYLGVENDSAARGVFTAIDLVTGELLWSLVDEIDCVLSDHAQPELVVCRDDSPTRSTAIERIDIATGQSIWSVSIPVDDELYWVDVVDRLVQVTAASGITSFNVVDGASLADSPRICVRPSAFVPIEFEVVERTIEYRSAQIPSFCEPNGTASDASTMVAAGATSGAALVDVGDGWLVAVGADGTISATNTR